MARALRIQYPGASYHVTCRGSESKDIFLSKEDQKVFLEKLALSSDTYNVAVLAYVLMTNHAPVVDHARWKSFRVHAAFQYIVHSLFQQETPPGGSPLPRKIQGLSG